MHSVFGTAIRFVAAALVIVAGFWLLHPSLEARCRALTPDVCLQGVWRPASPPKSKLPSLASALNSNLIDWAKVDTALNALATKYGDPSTGVFQGLRQAAAAAIGAGAHDRAAMYLSRAGQTLIGLYVQEETQGLRRQIRYSFLDLRDVARGAIAPGTQSPTEAQSKLVALATIFARLTAANNLAALGATPDLTSPATLAAVTALQNDTLAVRVFFATNRARTGDDVDYFTGDAAKQSGLEMGSAIATVPVPEGYAPDWERLTQISTDDALIKSEDGVGLGTLKHLAQDLFQAKLTTDLTATRRKEVLLYVHGLDAKFETAMLRAAEIKTQLRIAGPVILLSWPAPGKWTDDAFRVGRETCSDANTKGFMRAALLSVQTALAGAKVHVVTHGMGACATLSGFEAMDERGPIALGLASLSMIGAIDDPKAFSDAVARTPVGKAGRIAVYAADYDRAINAIDPTAVERPTWSLIGDTQPAKGHAKAEIIDVEIVEQKSRNVMGVFGQDFDLLSIRDDLRAVVWFAMPASGRCGLKPAISDATFPGPRWIWNAGKCGRLPDEPNQGAALELRREFDASAETKIEGYLPGIKGEDVTKMRDLLRPIPISSANSPPISP